MKLETEFKRQIARKLIDLARQALAALSAVQDTYPQRKLLGLVHILLQACTTRYEAVLLLLEEGYISEARALGRSLYDAHANMYWVKSNPSHAVNVFKRAHYSSWKKLTRFYSEDVKSNDVQNELEALESGRETLDAELDSMLGIEAANLVRDAQRSGKLMPDDFGNLLRKRVMESMNQRTEREGQQAGWTPGELEEMIQMRTKEVTRECDMETAVRSILSTDVHLSNQFTYGGIDVHENWLLDKLNDYFAWILAWTAGDFLHDDDLLECVFSAMEAMPKEHS